MNNEGYDSEGNLPHFADPDIEDDAELNNEEFIGGWGGVEMVLSPVVAPVAIDVMKLNAVQGRS